VNLYTSPRSTKLLHETGDGKHLLAIVVVRLKGSDFCCDLGAAAKSVRRVHEGRADGF
jgi:hypothetical protein